MLTIGGLWLAHKQTSLLADKKKTEKTTLGVKRRNIDSVGLTIQKREKSDLLRRI